MRVAGFFSVNCETKAQQQETKMLYRMTTGSPIFGLRREIDRLFDDTFTRDANSFTPAVDIKENENEIRLEAELPGIRPDDVEIIAENGVLTVRGQKESEHKEGDDRYQVVERTYGTFMRTFQLPQGVDENQIKADFENGVLTIHIPKAALPQPKRIQIGAMGQQRQQPQVGTGNTSRQQSSSGQQATARTSGQRSMTSSQRDSEKAAAQDR
jgi:HSP20 family protein